MRLIKTLIIFLTFPLPFSVILLLAGLIFIWFTNRQRLGKIIITAGSILLIICSLPLTTTFFIKILEDQHPALLDDQMFSERTKGVQYIVVLGGGCQDDPSIPPTSRHNHSQLVRAIEGFRLHKKLPDSKLVLSGGGYYQGSISAKMMAELLISLGVDKDKIIIEPDSLNTYQSAKNVHDIIKGEPFILVTSAVHMPRSVALFRKMGMDPVPAPTDYLYDSRKHLIPVFFIPNSRYLNSLDSAVYEFYGLVKEYLAGRI